MKVALATCKQLPETDPDEELIVSALEARDVRVRLLPWDDSTKTPEPGELVVLRSTWNYFEDVETFLAWTDRTASTNRLFNPASIVRTNAKKTYLRDLEARGIDVVPTEFVSRGAARRIEDVLRERRWTAIVIKPTVSAGSFLTQRFDASDVSSAQRFLDEVTSQRDAMIQCWMPAVDTSGERSLVYIDGQVTHAIRKSPRFIGGAESVTPAEIAPDERAFAERVLAPIRSELLYGRVDMIRDENGVLRVMELELIEPSLFFKQSAPALGRMVDAIVARTRDIG